MCINELIPNPKKYDLKANISFFKLELTVINEERRGNFLMCFVPITEFIYCPFTYPLPLPGL